MAYLCQVYLNLELSTHMYAMANTLLLCGLLCLIRCVVLILLLCVFGYSNMWLAQLNHGCSCL